MRDMLCNFFLSETINLKLIHYEDPINLVVDFWSRSLTKFGLHISSKYNDISDIAISCKWLIVTDLVEEAIVLIYFWLL